MGTSRLSEGLIRGARRVYFLIKIAKEVFRLISAMNVKKAAHKNTRREGRA